MAEIDERLTEQFHSWEKRGRGWQVYPDPVFPEPPFRPFPGHFLPETPVIDDGRVPTFLSSLVQKMSRKLSTETPVPPVIPAPEEEPEPKPLVRESIIEYQASLPEQLDVSDDAFGAFLASLSLAREPIAFEILGSQKKVTVQFATAPCDSPLFHRQAQAFFPGAVFIPRAGALEEAWGLASGDEALAVEFGLEREFMLPLGSSGIDPFVGLVGALSELQDGELGLFQVLWQPLSHPWAESIVRSVTHADGKPFFVNAPELAGAAESKTALPLYAAVIRILVRAESFDRVVELARDMAASLSVFAKPDGNALIPLHNDGYPFAEHIEDVLFRESRRTGMILNSDELMGFVHIPGSDVSSPAFVRQAGRTNAAPAIVRQPRGLLLGTNEHAGAEVSVRLSAEQRVRHVHVIGASGTGKSTLLFNLIAEDIANGAGVAVLDPHGDLIDRICRIIPRERIADVVLVDPSDEEYSVGFNILSAHSELEKTLLASDLVSVFQRLSTSWGDQMGSVLQNAVLAFLESARGGTVADLRRFLIEPPFRAEFLASVEDSEVVYYWQKSFPHLSGNKSIGSILTRLDALLAKKPIRHMVSQTENRLDFAHIMDSSKIFLAKLPEGLLGRENSHVLGSLFVSKFQQIAMSRQAVEAASRRDFWLYIDEFANFITPSMAEILSGARKYRIGLTLAHHELQQLERSRDVASAVMTHPYTRIVFRVGDDDAKKLADGFTHFEAKDIRNLDLGHAICRVERTDYDFNLSVPLPEDPDAVVAAERRKEVVTASRRTYGRLRSEIEAELRAKLALPAPEPKRPKAAVAPTSEKDAAAAPAPEPAPVPQQSAPPPTSDIPPSVALPAATPPEPSVSREPPRDLGRGGAQHKAIQARLKLVAEELGFRSVIEHPVLEGQGSVDLWLERPGAGIACEISVTTTIDHEVGNVAKCLKAGLPRVAVICLDEERLQKIRAAVLGSLGAEQAARVEYYEPDPFIAYLKSLKPASPEPAHTKYAGYTVTRKMPRLSADEQKQKEDIAHRILSEAMGGK